jgi:hyperosmotically inducible protein
MGQSRSDKMLMARINRAFGDQPVYKFPDVRVNTLEGVVQLTGFVANEQQKEMASEIAHSVRGVTQVQNDIAIAPLSPTERSLVRERAPD